MKRKLVNSLAQFVNFMHNLASKIPHLDKFFYTLLCAYSFALPSFNERTPHYLILYFIFFLLIICFVLIIFAKKKIRFSFFSLTFLLFASSAIVGTVFYSKNYKQLVSLFAMGVMFAFFYLTFLNLDKKKLLLAIYFGVSLFMIYFFIIYHNEIFKLDFLHTRLGLYFGNQNLVGTYFLFGVFISVYFISKTNKVLTKIFFCSLTICFLICVLSTGSRTHFICSCLAIIFAIIPKIKKNIKAMVVSIFCFVIVLILLFVLPVFSFITEQLVDSLLVIFGVNPSLDYSTYFRISYMVHAIDLGLHNYLFGLGSFGFTILSGAGTYSHSNLAEIFCNFGIFGLVTYYGAIAIIGYRAFKYKNAYFYLTSTFFILNLIMSLTSVNYFQKYQSLFFACFLCLACDDDYRCKKIHYSWGFIEI